MKKPNNYNVLIYIVMLVSLFFIGREIVINATELPFHSSNIFFTIITLLIAYLLTGILYELGHIIGAKICGYNIQSICLFGLTFYKENGKLTTRTDSYNGFTGETKVTPTDHSKNPTFFFLSGFLLNLIINITLLLVAFLVPNLNETAPIFYYGALLYVTLSMLICLYDILPISSDSVTPGINLRYVKKDSVPSYNKICELESRLNNAEELNGVEMIEEFNPSTSKLNYYALTEAIYKDDLDKAKQIIDIEKEHSSKLSYQDFFALVPTMLYVSAKTLSKEDFMTEYNNLVPSYRSQINKLDTIERCRVYLYICGHILENEVNVNNCLRKYRQAIKHLPYAGMRKQEEELATSILKGIQEEHTDWNVSW